MNRDEAQKLLGGYATGSLTDQERLSLFEAALDDQELFDQLAEEDALRELIEGPGVRDRLMATLTPRAERKSAWAWLWRPWPLTGLAGSIAVAIILWGALFRSGTRQQVIPQSETARVEQSPAQPAQVQQPIEVAQNRNDQPAARESRKERSGSTPSPAPPAAKDSATVSGLPVAPMAIAAPKLSADSVPTGVGATQGFVSRPAQAADARSDAVSSKAETATPPASVANGESRAMVIAGTPANTTVAPAPVPSAPAAKAITGNGGFADGPPVGRARGGATVTAEATLLTQEPSFGFRYQVQQGSLLITPNSAGWLTIRGVGDGPSLVIFASGQVPAGSPLKFDIPASAQRITIEFSVSETSAVGTVDQRAELQGAAAVANATENSHLAISVPARP